MNPILIVDDCLEDRMFAERLFHECKIMNPLVPLFGGQQCLDYFGRALPEELPALVLIDLAMPDRMGCRCCGSCAGEGQGRRRFL
jgi:CheY-like chemotaxis protein